MKKSFVFIFLIFSAFEFATAQKNAVSLAFTVSMENTAGNTFQVALECSGFETDSMVFKLPEWTPGYYKIMHYAKNLNGFAAFAADGHVLPGKQTAPNAWKVLCKGVSTFTVRYQVTAKTKFVAQSLLDSTHAYIVPASLFVYPDGHIGKPSTVRIKPLKSWKDVATGLDPAGNGKYTYFAPDFDVLYDSPILIGQLEALPEFKVKGIPHRFVGYQLGDFDRKAFVQNLKKVVEGAVDLIGDIPYKHYTFIAIGPGRGGIEHLNSTTVSFDGAQMNTPEGTVKMLSFLAHEYYHHYNVKRIRPIELGPFDYDKGNKTNMLWVSEGLTVYYEYLILNRQGLMSREEFFEALRRNIAAYENKPGHLYQSVAQASRETWSDGPFGRTEDAVNKTISYYDKGPALGMLLDLKIRHESGNKKSLDDVMRFLYRNYYLQKKRGFTEVEFRSVCEQAAGVSLDEFFGYVYTVNEVNYAKYLAYAGLSIDLKPVSEQSADKSFKITVLPDSDPSAKKILENWIR